MSNGVIEYVPGAGPEADESDEVEFVGGPRNGRREPRMDRPAALPDADGVYRRGVRCADDGALRYIWVPNVPADR